MSFSLGWKENKLVLHSHFIADLGRLGSDEDREVGPLNPLKAGAGAPSNRELSR